MIECEGSIPNLEIGQLIQRYHELLYGYAYRLSGKASDAEDLTQQAFLIAQQKLHQVRQPEKVRSWLLTIVRSCFLKTCRKRTPIDATALELRVDEIPQADRPEPLVDPEQLQLALDQLPEDFRIVLAMFYFQELSYHEIAEQLEIPIGTVMSRLSRAKGRLRRLLVDHVPALSAVEQPR